MPDESAQRDIEVRIEGDAATARLIISAAADVESVTGDALERVVREQHVEITGEMPARLAAIAEKFQLQPEAMDEVIASAVPPRRGRDGRIEFVEGFDPAQPVNVRSGQDDAGNVDFHNITSRVAVTKGTHVATVHPPEDGEDGRDVLGKAIPANSGEPSDLIINDETLSIDNSGRVTTKTSGALQLEGNELKVNPRLDVKGFVDFSTGNISFEGTVNISEGIRDQFTVKATEDINVGGLIEGAVVACGGNLNCRRGMAAKDNGQLFVEGDVRGVFFNTVRGWIRKDLHVGRELLNCELIIDGDLHCQSGTIIGGRTIVAGQVYAGTLGSRACIGTTLVLGTVPRINRKLKKLATLEEELLPKLDKQRQRLGAFSGTVQSMNAEQKEQVLALVGEYNEIQQQLEACGEKRAQLLEELRRSRVVDLQVSAMIHRKVVLVVGGSELTIERDLRGPLRVGWDHSKGLTVQQGESPIRGLKEVA